MTARLTYEAWLDAKDASRHRADAKAEVRIERREVEAEHLIGELCREGVTIYYINIKDKNGRPTGRTKEGGRLDLIAYLVRNGYV